MNENETTEVATVITKQHHHIGEDFVKRVQEMLGSGQLAIKSYAVNDEDWREIEAINFKVNEKVTLEISLKRSK